jgi:hypothetical protein
LAESFAVAAHGAKENGEILHSAGEDCAEENPKSAWEVTELRGECWADERAGSGDGGEMMTEQNPFVGGFKIVAIAQAFGGSGAAVIEQHDFGGNEFCVEAEADGVNAGGGGYEPQAVNGFAMIARNDSEANRARDCDGSP